MELIDENHVRTKAYVDSFYGNHRNIPDLLLVSIDQDNEFDFFKLTNLHGFTVKRNRTSDNEQANKKLLMIKFEKEQMLDFTKREKNV